jgi:hypothetical protein
MRARTWIAIVGLLFAVEAANIASRATVPVALRTTVVSGLAGRALDVTIPATVRLANGGGDSTVAASGGDWAGILIVKAAGGTPPYFSHFRLAEDFVCPGQGCAPPEFTDLVQGSADGGDGTFVLGAGTYRFVLLGDPGNLVTATIIFHSLTAGSLHATAGYGESVKTDRYQPGIGVGPAHPIARHYAGRLGSGVRFAATAVAQSVSQGVLYNIGFCFTEGSHAPSRRDPSLCLGGAALGDVGFFGMVPFRRKGTFYGISYLTAAYASPYIGMGFESDLVGVRTRTAALSYWVDLPG